MNSRSPMPTSTATVSTRSSSSRPRSPDEFAKCRYTLEARKYNGTVLFTKEVTPYYTGWDTFFLCYGEDENGVWGADVLCYQTHEDRGVGSCSYDLISYAGGRERYLDGNTITFVLEADGAAPVPDIRRATQAEFVRFREGWCRCWREVPICSFAAVLPRTPTHSRQLKISLPGSTRWRPVSTPMRAERDARV